MELAVSLMNDDMEFGQLGGFTYLDMAALGIAPASVRERVQAQLAEYMLYGTCARDEYRPDEIIRRANASVRDLLGAPAGYTFVGSTATAVSDAVLQAMPSGRGSVVCCTDDYPGLVTLARRYAARTGRELRLVPGEWNARALLTFIDEGTSVVLTSHVHWITGAVMDLAALSAARRALGFTFVVDASQAMPIVPAGAEIEEIDIFVSVAHKWLCGAPGAAIAHLSPRIIAQLNKTLDDDLWPVVPSNQSYTSMLALAVMSEWFMVYGPERVRERTLAAASTVRELALQQGWTLVSGSDDFQQSGIVTLSFPQAQASQFVQHMRTRGIYLSARGEGLRLSPHFTLSHEAIGRAIGTLSTAARELQF
ncbi:aminotransferase class V-fold PLP-dependent enzyme [Pluralibacter sp.]|uniref:aminotransferase class V-fold PLP-dependent enzyme n=1 Tax=Pluralibacter sp. TaxID=1920032 RepID=UPI0025DF1D81|nr:aminotransferase class V-fold PLP-dependent enzyme [Pluralibacter sp.]